MCHLNISRTHLEEDTTHRSNQRMRTGVYNFHQKCMLPYFSRIQKLYFLSFYLIIINCLLHSLFFTTQYYPPRLFKDTNLRNSILSNSAVQRHKPPQLNTIQLGCSKTQTSATQYYPTRLFKDLNLRNSILSNSAVQRHKPPQLDTIQLGCSKTQTFATPYYPTRLFKDTNLRNSILSNSAVQRHKPPQLNTIQLGCSKT